ncbi:MAG: hypothetical protein GTO53_12060 [Planctomycetales bacterium]|nr:hypothetical protein [Planctomycetales bacterium]NIM09844.1 hypothetical protein [Planctomycetales bacterium]NIN09688.1 hypothetical protein [Planctomycetales bacterium]NIN78803.1 hypothetical protein [Planctomycetales bacterium]NIO35979.1 hypothetical protein [Planctomycetales bacterium]
MRRIFWFTSFFTIAVTTLFQAGESAAQSFGIELHSTLMPASGGMAGASLARPQDVNSALASNPATLTQFLGTQFTFGGGWVEPNYQLEHAGGVLPNVDAFAGKSESEGSALGNIVVAQDLRDAGVPGTFALGLLSSAGAGVHWRDIPASNGTSVLFQILEIGMGLGVEVTDRMSVGATLVLGSAVLDAPFVGIGGAAYDYSLRGAAGLHYQLNRCTSVGLTYHTAQNFNFDNALRLDLGGGLFTPTLDVNAGLPDNIGLGIANQSLLDGRLLLAADVLYKQWDNADLFRAVYDNQWVLQLGAQYEYNTRLRLRAGYALAEDPLSPNPGNSAGGVTPPGALAALQYLQATVAVSNRHRFSLGAGLRDLLPGVDLDVFGGFMFENTEQLGAFTQASLESYWLGSGLTWRFGPRACRRLPEYDCACDE